mmetsp:Transcript_15301/g.43738  ORF Transcript_15301/g.43738 Transcript_15301/m.43738 type:complete len:638 (-) Transcript_15301:436-2349(-)
MATLLKEIVDHLNAEPFHMNLTLVTFDEKQPIELLETLNAILVHLDGKKHEVDVREENQDNMYVRMAGFLHVIGCKANYDEEFQKSFVAGDKRTLYPIIHWLLSDLERLRKRAYLAHYLVPIDVPPEFLGDEAMMEMYQQYKGLQAQFKSNHQALEQAKETSTNPSELRKELQQLEAEKEQLQQKIASLQSKTQNKEGFDALLEVTSSLRKEQEEEARIAEKIREQRVQLEQAEQQYMLSTQRLAELKSSIKDSDAGAETMLKVLRDEVNRNRENLERYRREVDEKKDRLHTLEATLSEPPVSQVMIRDLESQVAGLRDEIQTLEDRLEEDANQTDDKLTVFKQQANLVGKKKEIALKELKDAEHERSELSQRLSDREREYEERRGHKFLRKDEFKQYAAELREKTAKYKEMKADLNEIRQEVATLTRTEQILQQRDERLAKTVAELEAKRGVAGYQTTERSLEEISAHKAQVDKSKEVQLDELSRIVTEITNQLKDKKNQLAPQIKNLREVRAQFQELEAKYNEKKGAYNSVQLAVDSDLSRLRHEVETLQVGLLSIPLPPLPPPIRSTQKEGPACVCVCVRLSVTTQSPATTSTTWISRRQRRCSSGPTRRPSTSGARAGTPRNLQHYQLCSPTS